jgi:hypothetical protein
MPRMVGMSLIGGLAWHNVSQSNFLQKIETGKDLPENKLEEILEKCFQSQMDEHIILVPPGKSLKDLVEETRARMKRLVPAYAEYAAQITPARGGIEKRLVIPGTNSYPEIVCYLDLIDSSGFVRDLKTTTRTWGADDIRTDHQLAAYGLAYRVEFGKDPAGFSFDFLVAPGSGDSAYLRIKNTTRTAKDYVAFLKKASYVWKMVNAEIFPPASKGWWCSQNTCSFTSACEYYPK